MRILTENEKAELLRDFRQMKNQDDKTIELLAELYDVSVQEVKEIMANERNKAFQWTDERVHRLKAYIAQGMGNTAIANELGCKVQCVADYKKRNKAELMRFDKKKQLPTAGTVESSEKLCRKQPVCCSAGQTGAHIGAPLQNNYNTNKGECQEKLTTPQSAAADSSPYTGEPATEVSEGALWSARYMELSKAQGEALSRLYECEAFLTAASDAGRLWGCVADAATGEHTGSPLRKYIEMYRVICERALECCCAAVETLEKE